jgi:uncharacterized protein
MSTHKNNQFDQSLKIIIGYLNPEKIILFGSRANGDFSENSDYDLFVLKNGISHKRKITQELYKLLYPTKLAIDLIIETPENFELLKSHTSFIYYQVDKFGKVVYEKK